MKPHCKLKSNHENRVFLYKLKYSGDNHRGLGDPRGETSKTSALKAYGVLGSEMVL